MGSKLGIHLGWFIQYISFPTDEKMAYQKYIIYKNTFRGKTSNKMKRKFDGKK